LVKSLRTSLIEMDPSMEFNLSLETRETFYYGGCVTFALTLIDKIGGELYGLHCEWDEDPDHFVVKRHGLFIDVNGIFTEEQLLEYSFPGSGESTATHLKPAREAVASDFCIGTDINPDLAPLAITVLDSLIERRQLV
jgi:hypothetical protein